MTKQNATFFSHVPFGADAYLFSEILKSHSEERCPVFVLPHDEDISKAQKILSFFYEGERDILTFPNWDCLAYDRVSPSKSIVAERLHTLFQLRYGKKKHCVITSIAALLQQLPPISILQDRLLILTKGQNVSLEALQGFCHENGYERLEVVTQPGQYTVRGGIVDIFPPGETSPKRLDFFGEELESIKSFDIETQRTTKTHTSITLTPTTEIFLTQSTQENFRATYRKQFGIEATKDPLYEAVSDKRFFPGQEHWMPCFYPKMTHLLTYCGPAHLFMPANIKEISKSHEEQILDHFQARSMQADSSYRPLQPDQLYLSWERLEKELSPHHKQFYTRLRDPKGEDLSLAVPLDLQSLPKGKERLVALQNYIQDNGLEPIVTANSPGAETHLKNYFAEHNLNPQVTCLPLSDAFRTNDHAFFHGDHLLGTSLQTGKYRPKKAVSSLFEVMNFQEGDLLVHRDYGIGCYHGLQNMTLGGAAHDCIALEYDKGDKLYVPVENMEVLSFYGSEEERPSLDRLGGSSWDLRRARTKKRIQEIAEKLMAIAAVRKTQRTQPFQKDIGAYEEFCRLFPYMETEDQARAIEEVIQDLSQDRPMDRLLCGDVGFGKTEVALRAAFVVAQAGYQVALVCPTTLLCSQHFQTFKKRFHSFGFNIACLSRFQKPKEAAQIREDLKAGKIDIVVGTHALLSSSINFQKLGLVIVDEEQHFGVKQKEHLKTMVKNVHVLSMSATPIPRSLQMAVSGIRDLSTITTPPLDRLAVHTFVSPYDSVVIREAILREIHRGGQVFYVCPRIADIDREHEKLQKLVPEIKIAVGHGRMTPEALSQTVQAFEDHHYDLLLSTNIVESGLDIPNANTMIVHRSDILGLSQLYQLRGRVGRSKARGYAYFTFTPDKTLTPNALKRLEVLQNLEGLGGGFSLASRDMDIRGMGNLVGEAQSGHVKEVGVSLYNHMLEEAILACKEGKNAKTEPEWTPQISLGLDVLIPEAYIPALNLRLSFYRRLSDIKTMDDQDDLKIEMIDRFGDIPQETNNLFEVVRIKNLCKSLSIEKVDAGPKGVLISFFQNQCPYVTTLLTFMGHHQGVVKLRPDHKMVISKAWSNSQERVKGVYKILEALQELVAQEKNL